MLYLGVPCQGASNWLLVHLSIVELSVRAPQLENLQVTSLLHLDNITRDPQSMLKGAFTHTQ